MKKIFILTALAAAAMSLAACKNDQIEPEAPEATLAIEKSELIIPAKGGEAFLVIKSESAFKAAAEKDWCNITIDKDTVRIAAAANETLDSRYSKVTLTNAEESTSVMIQQFGFKTSSFGPADITCSSDAVVYDFPYEYDEVLEASANQDWVTLTITENNLNVSIAENTVQATADNRSRKAEISWKLGIDAGTINVEQLNVDFMQPDANWTVAYEGYKVYEGNGNKYEHISNTVADPTISGMYYFTYFSKDEYTASKLKMGDFIATLVPGLKAEADDIIDYYKSEGYDLTYEDLLYEDSDYEIFDKFEEGDYYGCVIGFDKTFTPTGHYAVAEFTKKNDGPATGYSAWLGDWKCPHGNSTTKFDTWTFTEKEKGLTYWVTGIEGYTDLKIEVEYDEASEGIIVRAQEEIGTMTIGSKGECSMGFYGATTSGNLWTPGANPYAIFTATIDGNSAQLVAATLKTDTGDVQPDIAAYIGKDSNGGFTLPKSFNDATRTNVVLTKVTGGGGEDTPSDTYKNWIGKWATSEGFALEIKEQKANESYVVEGFGETAELGFDTKTGNILVCFQELTSSEKWDFYIAGVGTNNYVAYGDNETGLLAIGTMAKDGKSFSLKGHVYTYTFDDGETEDYDIAMIGLMGYGTRSDGSTGWVSFTDAPMLDLPATLSASSASGSAIRKAALVNTLLNTTMVKSLDNVRPGEYRLTPIPVKGVVNTIPAKGLRLIAK